ncbi:MAG: hypothetical protein M1609_13310, partial [Firmicutes bacterium]|nr:hypothetical protein [Bacillota bacterium]
MDYNKFYEQNQKLFEGNLKFESRKMKSIKNVLDCQRWYPATEKRRYMAVLSYKKFMEDVRVRLRNLSTEDFR